MLGYSGGKDLASLLAYTVLAAKITGKDTKELENLHKYFGTLRSREEFEKIVSQLRI